MSNLEPLIVTGELIFLTAEERIRFYVQVCESMGLNVKSDALFRGQENQFAGNDEWF